MWGNTQKFMSLWAGAETGHLQGAWVCGWRRVRHRTVHRHDLHGGDREDRIYVHARLGLSVNGHVGSIAWAPRRPNG